MTRYLERRLGMKCMDFIFYYPAQFRGVDTKGDPQLFAFCGARVDSNNVYTLCGSLSQNPVQNALLSEGQEKQSNASFADPLNFGITNKNAGGTAKVADQCTASTTISTTTTMPTTTTGSTSIVGTTSSAIARFTSSSVILFLSSWILYAYLCKYAK